MGGSIKIGNVFGIPVRLHWMFLVLLYAYPLVADDPPLTTLGMLLLLFGTVFLHELGHCLMAMRFGIRVVDITLWPLGGMARLSDMPENSRIEGWVAIAGPLVNFALALLAFAVLIGAGLLGIDAVTSGAQTVLLMNLVMGVFNLVPAFPMDGGRILRAWFARKNDWLAATEKAVTVGRFFAVLMFFASIGLMLTLQSFNCMLPVITLFIWFAGARELLGVRLRHGQGIFGAQGAQSASGSPFAQAFGGAARSAGPEPARRPDIDVDKPAIQHRGGFTESDVQRLEKFRGRLRGE